MVGQAAAGTRTTILEPGLPVDVRDGLWGRGSKKVLDSRSRVLTEFMRKIHEAAGPGARMPVVKLTMLRPMAGVHVPKHSTSYNIGEGLLLLLDGPSESPAAADIKAEG